MLWWRQAMRRSGQKGFASAWALADLNFIIQETDIRTLK
jgi:hypothetical protein